MKVKLLMLLFFIANHVTYSQTEQLINGIVLCEQLPVIKVDIANYNSKQVVITNALGTFSIAAKIGDELIFISKKHYIKKITVDQKGIETTNLIIYLSLKPEELKEVLVTKIPAIKLSKDAKWEQGKLDKIALEKAVSTPKVLGVYTGGIENGVNLMRIGGMIIKLFRKEKDVVKKELAQIDFKNLARSSCDKKFYLETLKLSPDEMELFLEFCDADPNAKTVALNENVLSMMDFLYKKNSEFKKL